MNNWINVNDRLPESLQEVLTLQDTGCYDIGSVYWNDNDLLMIWELNSGDQMTFRGKVTHWQPLPEEPNMKSVGNQEDGMIDGIMSSF